MLVRKIGAGGSSLVMLSWLVDASGNWVAPVAGDYLVAGIGSGAAGGYDNGSGGSSGQFKIAKFTLTAGQSVTVTIGAAGTSSSGNPDAAGAACTFGGLLSCAGGTGGASNSGSRNTSPGGTASYGGAGYTSAENGGSNGQSPNMVVKTAADAYFGFAGMYLGSALLAAGAGGAWAVNSGGGAGGLVVNGDTSKGGHASPSVAAYAGIGYGAGGAGGAGSSNRAGGSGVTGCFVVAGLITATL